MRGGYLFLILSIFFQVATYGENRSSPSLVWVLCTFLNQTGDSKHIPVLVDLENHLIHYRDSSLMGGIPSETCLSRFQELAEQGEFILNGKDSTFFSIQDSNDEPEGLNSVVEMVMGIEEVGNFTLNVKMEETSFSPVSFERAQSRQDTYEAMWKHFMQQIRQLLLDYV